MSDVRRMSGIRVGALTASLVSIGAAVALAVGRTAVAGPVDHAAASVRPTAVTTYHNDPARTGANTDETSLSATNVSVAAFGKLFSRAVDGHVYAQPLYVPAVSVPGQGLHNVVYVCTQHNGVFAFDADHADAAKPLWHVSLGPSVPARSIDSTRDIAEEIGITSTPVIDLSTQILYVVAQTLEGSAVHFRLHALGLGDGSERFGGPAEIEGSVAGSGADAVNGRLAFNPRMHWQRPALLLSRGKIYIAFGSHQDLPPFHGWLFAYTASTLARAAVLCLSPDATAAGIWQGGVGPAADTDGNVYVVTGDGLLNADRNGRDYGDSVVKLSEQLAVVDFFSPSDQASLRRMDRDLGATGPILIPGAMSLVAGAKDGRLFVLDRGNLGRYHDQDRAIQQWRPSSELFGGFVYFNQRLFVGSHGASLKAFRYDGRTFEPTPISQTIQRTPDYFANGPAMSLSSDGPGLESAILWAAYSKGRADGGAYAGILRAFAAADLSRELWNSDQNGPRDYAGSWAKWCPPTVANGKVYLATFDNVLNVYGKLPAGRP